MDEYDKIYEKYKKQIEEIKNSDEEDWVKERRIEHAEAMKRRELRGVDDEKEREYYEKRETELDNRRGLGVLYFCIFIMIIFLAAMGSTGFN